MAFITMNQYATEPRVTADHPDFVDVHFGKDHRIGLSRDEASKMADDLLAAVRAMDAQREAA